MIRIEYTDWKEDAPFLEKVRSVIGRSHSRRWNEHLWSAQWREHKVWSVELRRAYNNCRFIWQINNPELELWFLLNMLPSAKVVRRTS